MKKLFEDWRKHLSEETAAFHGYGMEPTQMRVPQCDTPPDDSQWEAEEEGCPQFTNDKGISLNHEDVIEAVEYIDNVKPSKLIAYSRGGAMAIAAMNKGVSHSPEITFVAPAWKRGWAVDLAPPSGLQGAVIHGTKDAAVPLRQSFELARHTGLPLYVFPEMKHVNILKHKGSPTGGIQVSDRDVDKGLDMLPDWGESQSSPEQVEEQHRIAMEILSQETEMLQERKSDDSYIALANFLVYLIKNDGAGVFEWQKAAVRTNERPTFPNSRKFVNYHWKEGKLHNPDVWGYARDIQHGGDIVYLYSVPREVAVDKLYYVWDKATGLDLKSDDTFINISFLLVFIKHFKIAVYADGGRAAGSMNNTGQMNLNGWYLGLVSKANIQAKPDCDMAKQPPTLSEIEKIVGADEERYRRGNYVELGLDADGKIPMPEGTEYMCPALEEELKKWEALGQEKVFDFLKEKTLDWGGIKELIVHEIAHFVNSIRADYVDKRDHGAESMVGGTVDYAHSTEEIQARLITMFRPLKDAMTSPATRWGGKWSHLVDMKRMLYKAQVNKDKNALREFMNKLLKAYSTRYGYPLEDPKFANKKVTNRIINRVYDFATDLIKSHDFSQYKHEWTVPEFTTALQENKGDTCRKTKRTIRITKTS